MESGGEAGMGMASNRSGGPVELRRNGLHRSGYRGFLMVALLFVTATTVVIEDVHCSITTDAVAPASAPSTQQTESVATFNVYEAEALNTIFQIWSKQNPQFSTILNWSLEQPPCKNLTGAFEKLTGNVFQGAWSGVGCTSVLRNLTEIPRHYLISVTSLTIYGGNSSCTRSLTLKQCGFDGIIGQLPSEISNLTNLQTIIIMNNPKLTGPVPDEILQLPYLETMYLYNNSLNGTLPSDVYNADCQLQTLNLGHNNFSGSLRLSSQGTLFCPSLQHLSVAFNLLDGPLNLQNWNGNQAPSSKTLYFNNNHFGGKVFVGPYFDVEILKLSYNNFTSIQFAKYIGPTQSSGLDTIYMPSLYHLDISNNNISGLFFDELKKMPALQRLDLSMNNFFGLIDLGSLNVTTKLNYLNISNNNFNGTFFMGPYFNPTTMDLSNNQFNDIIFHLYNKTTHSNRSIYLPSLEKIYLQNNSLVGQFPTKLLTAPNLRIMDASQNEYKTLILPTLQFDNSNLSQVFITNNTLDEVYYSKSGLFTSYNLQILSLLLSLEDLNGLLIKFAYKIDSLGGNPICNKIDNAILSTICRFNQTEEPRHVVPKSNTKMKVIIATSTSSALVLVFLVTGIYVWRLMGKIKALHIILEEFNKKEVKPNLYSYREVKLATNNFHKDNKLGEGGFGVVYKEKLLDGTQAAVKKLIMSSNQVLSEFLNEVIVISGLKHRNLVKLKGCCLGDGDQRILVFEYVENNNLAQALWMHDDLESNIEPRCLDWKTRFNIIVGIARGLAYLHEELQPPIIHRDIKATNILLDKNYNAKIADFGLAYLYPTLDNEASHLTLMQVAGTRGYCSPEYAIHGHVSTALDVYSFGILLLEIVSRRKNIDLQKPSEEIYLRDWAWKQYEAKASMTLIDQKMEHFPTDLEVILCILNVAFACVDYKAARRPKMHNVVPMLSGNMSINQFQTSFEDGDEIVETSGEFPITVDTSSFLWSNENILVDDCVLLNNIGGLQMNLIVK